MAYALLAEMRIQLFRKLDALAPAYLLRRRSGDLVALATQDGFQSRDIESIVVKASAAAVGYPGCDYAGPFERILQAKMSIQYCVAATLARGVP